MLIRRLKTAIDSCWAKHMAFRVAFVEILNLEPKNFEIPYKDVSSVTLRKRWASGGIIEFVFEDMKKLVFLFLSKQFSEAEKIIRQVLGDKLK